jgi:hypothetical protein
MSTKERLARLEGIIEQINRRLDSIDHRLNTHLVIMISLWITTLAAIFGSAIFIK